MSAEEPDLLLALAVSGASRLIAQGEFTEPPSSVAAKRDWCLGGDPVLAWLDSDAVLTRQGPEHVVRTNVAYRSFAYWAEQNCFDRYGLPRINKFTQRIRGVQPDPYVRRSDGPVFQGMIVLP